MALLTTIAAGVAIAGTAATTAKSFSDAKKSRDAMRDAEAEAESKMKEARARLDVNFADALSINKEPYERQREAMLAAGAQALEAGVESERGGAATAGRVLAAQQNAQGDIRDEMNRDLYDLEAAKAEEASRLRDINVSLDLGQLEGAQIKAAEMENRANIQTQKGIEGSINVLQEGVALPGLFSNTTRSAAPASVDTSSIQGANNPLTRIQQDFSTPKYNAGDVLNKTPITPRQRQTQEAEKIRRSLNPNPYQSAFYDPNYFSFITNQKY